MSKLIPYLGGKRLLAKTIVGLLPKHHCYCEPFAGSATILLSKEPSKVEVINDLNLEIINLFRVVQNHLEEFLRCLGFALVSREWFDVHKASPPQTLTDVQRAVRYFFLMRAGYGGKVTSQHFAGGPNRGPRPLTVETAEKTLREVHRRLAGAVIERLPYTECIERYDRKNTLFVIDPPYHGYEKDYGKGVFGREDFAGLAELLGIIKGKFLLTINDVAEVRKIFKGFHIMPVQTTYSAGTAHGRTKKARELLVANYDLGKG